MKRLSLIAASLFAMVLALSGCATKSDDGWVTLLDGTQGMENFNAVGNSNWAAVDGAIQADKRGKDTGFLVSKDFFSNYQLRVEFWSSPDANSGIFMRCANPRVITDKSCYEANIFDSRPDPSFGTGGIVHHAKVLAELKAGNQWNTFDITAYDSKITVMLNGVKTAELDHKQFAIGPIALQHGAGVIKFRKVQIRKLWFGTEQRPRWQL
ncbi:MAG: DUF1080 domain-containing protein [Burkholderiales bacterium]